MNKEQFNKNIERHKARNIIDVFDDDLLNYPTSIIFNSPLYGKYRLKPFFYISLLSDKPTEMSNAIEEISKISSTKSSWNIKEINNPNSPEHGISIEFIYYLIDWKSNLDWKENNLDCEYLKDFPDTEFLPLSNKNDYMKIQEIWNKYPMTKIENYILKKIK